MDIDVSKLPYRPCVGAMILNPAGLVWIGHRFDAIDSEEARGRWWQMPQGGIDEGENPAVAVFREVMEETSMRSLVIAAELPGWHNYDLPPALGGKMWGGKYKGQTQKWFALRFTGPDSEIDITVPGHKPEFDQWRWAKPADLLDVVVPFKRTVYEAVLADAAKLGAIG